jgi:hypothetical protein
MVSRAPKPPHDSDSDSAIISTPYRPFYNIFGSNTPILVKQ